MSIKGLVTELEHLNIEIKNNNAKNKNLRVRCKAIEAEIADFLQSKGQPGLKYNGKAIIMESKEKRMTKNRKSKEAAAIAYLHDIGIDNPEDVYAKLQDVQKGEPIETTSIKLKNLRR